MSERLTDAELARAYHLEFATALVRQRLPHLDGLSAAEQFRAGLTSGLRLHHFKRTGGLARVKKVLGILRGLAPTDIIDLGSGRGVFLWPLLDSFAGVSVLSIDRNPLHVADIHGVAMGGIDGLRAARMDIAQLGLADGSADVVTFLEVLEHLPNPLAGLREALRVARRFVVLSVPSQEDDNPEHLHLFTRAALTQLCAECGVRKLTFDAVLNHHIVVASR